MPRHGSSPSTLKHLAAMEQRGRQVRGELALELRALFVGAGSLAPAYTAELRDAVRALAKSTGAVIDETLPEVITTTERGLASHYYRLCGLVGDSPNADDRYKLLRRINLAVHQAEERTSQPGMDELDGYDALDAMEADFERELPW